MQHLIIEHKRAPGDVLVLSALIRDIALTHPDAFTLSVNTASADIWRHNPYVVPLNTTAYRVDGDRLVLSYGDTLKQVGSHNYHFLCGFYQDFEQKTGIHVPILYPRPDYHLSPDESDIPIVAGRYWVIVAGGKSDFITKHWGYKRWQQTVNVLNSFGIRCVQVGALSRSKEHFHMHPILENVTSLVGQTTLRDLARLIYHADGVICGVTAAMHFAAALEKPCVVIAGGREEWWWEAYIPRIGNFGTELREDVRVPHRFLHTIGLLDCCSRRGCWRNKVTGDKSVCKYPLAFAEQIIPKCMDMITINHVVEAVMSYYEDGTLPPIGIPKRIVFIDGKARLLKDHEPIPDIPSALIQAFTYIEPTILTKTEKQLNDDQ